jgi:hypothetical protein
MAVSISVLIFCQTPHICLLPRANMRLHICPPPSAFDVHARPRTSVTYVDVRARARCESGLRRVGADLLWSVHQYGIAVLLRYGPLT